VRSVLDREATLEQGAGDVIHRVAAARLPVSCRLGPSPLSNATTRWVGDITTAGKISVTDWSRVGKFSERPTWRSPSSRANEAAFGRRWCGKKTRGSVRNGALRCRLFVLPMRSQCLGFVLRPDWSQEIEGKYRTCARRRTELRDSVRGGCDAGSSRLRPASWPPGFSGEQGSAVIAKQSPQH